MSDLVDLAGRLQNSGTFNNLSPPLQTALFLGGLTLPGVGRKTANLVLILSFKSGSNICVDTHVHRISNRLGYVKTKTPDETEMALRKKLPRRYWIMYNDLLVAYGQNLCKPISPFCSRCRIAVYCRRVGVTTKR